jgi:phosphoserine aminotransferase
VEGKAKLQLVLDKTRLLLNLPKDYRIGIVAASDTGAFEMSLWSMLGAREVDILAWESFGHGWVMDVEKQLKLSNTRVFDAEYGKLPDLSEVDFSHDVVFLWNGTTSGVRVPNGDWIPTDRQGLTICDATSAIFAMELPWDKLDVVTYSWQKVMGGEAQHGMLILSPRAVSRLETYTPPRPIPKIFRLTSDGKLIEGIFTGATINTPSMLCVEDAIDGLNWAERVGGVKALVARSAANLEVLRKWVEGSKYVDFLAENPGTISSTSVCIKIIADWFCALGLEEQRRTTKKISALLEEETVAYDINAYRDAPPGLRIWAGSTIEVTDLEALTPWVDWAISVAQLEVTS